MLKEGDLFPILVGIEIAGVVADFITMNSGDNPLSFTFLVISSAILHWSNSNS